MNYTLIMLDIPVLVSDEFDERGRKIIAGFFGKPKLDLSLIADEIGWVDVEKLAEEKYPIQIGGSAWMPTTHDCIQANKQEGFIEGFKAAQSLNEKKRKCAKVEFQVTVDFKDNIYKVISVI